jgi:uncharacterized BrkB/YihY/UPF0761 family membrane protein
VGVADIDGLQRRHRALAFPLAVARKYVEDRGNYVAAIVTYYAFFSLFPLLIVATTLLGFVAQGDPELQERLYHSALGRIPLLGSELRVHALTGSAWALVAGLAISLWAGMRVFVASESAAEWIWYEHARRFTGFLRARLRAFELLVVIGGGALATTVLAVVANAVGNGLLLLNLAADFGLFWLANRLLAPPGVAWRRLAPGAAVGAAGWAVLQQLGTAFVSHAVMSASATYGTFAAVIGLLSFVYLAVNVAIVATEISAVSVRGLWPRSLAATPTQGDYRAAALRTSALFPQAVGVVADSRSASAAGQSVSSTQDGGR